jgi:hypothetical protein
MSKPSIMETRLHQQSEGTLDPAEEKDLERMESTIAANLAAFFQVGFALLEIRRRRLYRAEFKSFEEYCRKRWEFNRSYAYRLIGAAKVCKQLSPIGDIPLPDNECQIRALAGLPSSIVTKAWRRAHEKAGLDGRITGALVQKAVTEIAKRKKPGKHPRKQTWQLHVEPLLQAALRSSREGDQERVAELIDKVSLLLLIGRRISVAAEFPSMPEASSLL